MATVRGQTKRIAIIGTNSWAIQLAEDLRRNFSAEQLLVGYISDCLETGNYWETELGAPFLGHLKEVDAIITEQNIDILYLVISPESHQKISVDLLELTRDKVKVRLISASPFLMTDKVNYEIARHELYLTGLTETTWVRFNQAAKRILDVVLALLLIVVVSPVMLLICALICLDSPGGPLLKQKRIGKNGQFFEMFKFRSMYSSAHKKPCEALDQIGNEGETPSFYFKTRNDFRVTRIGRLLRRSSLDELPQLFNVINGSMSLVGPRPELPEIVQLYQPWQLGRFIVRPGITGWWQINGRSDNPMHLSTEYDWYYIHHFSFFLDLKILFATLFTVISGRGAY